METQLKRAYFKKGLEKECRLNPVENWRYEAVNYNWNQLGELAVCKNVLIPPPTPRADIFSMQT